MSAICREMLGTLISLPYCSLGTELIASFVFLAKMDFVVRNTMSAEAEMAEKLTRKGRLSLDGCMCICTIVMVLAKLCRCIIADCHVGRLVPSSTSCSLLNSQQLVCLSRSWHVGRPACCCVNGSFFFFLAAEQWILCSLTMISIRSV